MTQNPKRPRRKRGIRRKARPFLGAIELLETRLLLTGFPLSDEQAGQLLSGMDGLVGFGDRLSDSGYMSEPIQGLRKRDGSPLEFGEIAPIGRTIDEGLANPVRDYFSTPAPAGGYTTELLLLELQRGPYVLSVTEGYTDADIDEFYFEIHAQRFYHPLEVEFAFGELEELYGLGAKTDLHIDMEVRVDLRMTFGLILDSSLNVEQAFFVRDVSMDVTATVEGVLNPFTMQIGILEIAVPDARLEGVASIHIGNDRGTWLDTIRLSELNSADPETVVGSSLDSNGFDYFYDMDASIGSFRIQGTSALRMYGEMLGIEPVYEFSTDFMRLLPFSNISMEEVTSGMEQFGSWLSSVSRSDLFDTPIPFTSQATVGNTQDLGLGLAPFLDSLRTAGGQVAYDAVQTFPVSGNNGLDYDEATQRLSIVVSQPLQAQRTQSRKTRLVTDETVALNSDAEINVETSGNIRFVTSFDLSDNVGDISQRTYLRDIRVDSVITPSVTSSNGITALLNLGLEYGQAALDGSFALTARLGDPNPAVQELTLARLFDRLSNPSLLVRRPFEWLGNTTLELTNLSAIDGLVTLAPTAEIRAQVSDITNGSIDVSYVDAPELADFESLSFNDVVTSIRDALLGTADWSAVGDSSLIAVGQSILDYADLQQDRIAGLIDDLLETYVPQNALGRPLLQEIPDFMSQLPLNTLYQGIYNLTTDLYYDAQSFFNTTLDLSLDTQTSVPVGLGFQAMYDYTATDDLERTDDFVGSSAQVAAIGSSKLRLEHQMESQAGQAPVGYVLPTSEWTTTAYAYASPLLGTAVAMSGASGALGLEINDGEFIIAGDVASPNATAPARFSAGLASNSGRMRVRDLPPVPPSVLIDGGLRLDVAVIPETTGNTDPERFHFEIGDLEIPDTSALVVSSPNFPTLRSQLDLLQQLSAIPPSVSKMLGKLAAQLERDVFGIPLPLIGNSLDDAANFIRDVQAYLDAAFGAISDFSLSDIESAINQAIGILFGLSGNQVGDYVDIDATLVDSIRFHLHAQGAPINEALSVDTDLGLPALGVSMAASLSVLGTYDFALDIVVSRDEGVYIDTTNETIRMDLDVDATGAAAGRLGWLAVSAVAGSSTPNTPAFHAEFVVDLDDPNHDGMLKPNELNQGSLIQFDHTTLRGDADFNVQFDASGSVWLPSIRADLGIVWSFDGTDLRGSVPEIEYRSVELLVGAFLDKVLGPLLDRLDPILTPLQPIVDLLNQNLPVLDDLGVEVSLISIAEEIVRVLPGNLRQQFQRYLDFVIALSDLVNLAQAIDTESGSMAVIDLGSLHFGGNSTPQYDARLRSLTQDVVQLVTQPGDWFEALAAPGAAPQTAAVLRGTPSAIDFPMLDNPLSVFEWILGFGEAELVTVDLPGFEMSVPFELMVPIFPGILQAGIFGSIEVGFGLKAGIDTYGAKDFFKSGDPADLLQGFYISDRENADGTGPDVLELPVTGKALAGLQVGFDVGGVGLSARVGGGIEATIGIDLIDPDNDGKVRGSEWSSPEGCMAIKGGVKVTLEADATVGFLNFNLPLASKQLGGFNQVIYCGDDSLPTSKLAEFDPSDGSLNLLMGPRAGERGVAPSAHNETFLVSEAGGLITVQAFGRTQTFAAGTIKQIYGNAGDGIDRILIDNTVSVPVVLLGGSGDDTLIAGTRSATLSGGDGNDWIEGSSQNDFIVGNDGNDQIWGKGGDDTIDSGSDDDVVYGGIGNDVILTGEGINEAYGEGGRDRITGGTQKDYLYGGDDGDFLFGLGGNDVLLGDDGSDEIYGSDGDDLIDGGEGDDTELHGGLGKDTMYGGLGNDVLYGEEEDDYLDGGDNDDILEGGDGVLTAHGGSGNDHIFGGPLADFLFGESGIDELFGRAGADQLFGGTEQDFLYGEQGADFLSGDEGGDVLQGGIGDDELDGGIGDDFLFGNTDNVHEAEPTLGQSDNDRIEGGPNADWIVGGFGDDRLYGQDGWDTLQGNEGQDYLEGNEGDDVLYGHDSPDFQRGNSDGRDELYGNADQDSIWGGAGPDFIRGGNGFDRLYGEGGADEIYGDEGADTIEGDRGEDIIDGGEGGDTIDGGRESDRIYGNLGGDTIRGRDEGDLISGNDGDDFLYGDAGIDDVRGGRGNDTLEGGMEDDQLRGDDGNDILYGNEDQDTVEGNNGLDQLFGGTGDDVLSGGSDDDYIEGNEDQDQIFGDNGNDIAQGNDGDDTMNGGFGNDTLRGGFGNDTIQGDAGDDLILGHHGDDTLSGGANDDVIRGGFGLDTIHGENGNDRLYGDEDSDTVAGDAGDDVVEGGDGDDDLSGDDGDDALYGDQGIDHLSGGNDDDILFAGSGIGDVLNGDAGNDEIVGSDDGKDDPKFEDTIRFGDVIDGGDGDDTIHGLGGGDYILGGLGNDNIYGGTHGDWIQAGLDVVASPATDNDTVFGGDGNDQAFGGDGDDSLFGGDGTNTLDGGSGVNVIDPSAVAPGPSFAASSGLERRGLWSELSGSATGIGLTGVGGLEQSVLSTEFGTYVAWVDWRNGNTEIYVAYHPNGVGTWTQLTGFQGYGSASGGGVSNDANQSRRPALFRVKNRDAIYVAWTSIDENGASFIEVATDFDGWARIPNPGQTGTADNAVAVSYDDNAAVLAWINTRPNGRRAAMAEYVFAPGCFDGFLSGTQIPVNASPGDNVTDLAIASTESQVVFALEVGAGDDRDIQLVAHRGAGSVDETDLCPAVPNANASAFTPGSLQVIHTVDLDDTTEPTVGIQFMESQGQNEIATEVVLAWHHNNAWEDQVEGVVIRLPSAGPIGIPRPLIPKYLSDNAARMNATSVSDTVGYASNPSLAVSFYQTFLTWADDGVRSTEGGSSSLFILTRDRDTDPTTPYVLDERRLLDAQGRGLSATGNSLQEITTSIAEYGLGIDSPVVVWTEAHTVAAQGVGAGPTSGVYLRVSLPGLALFDDLFSVGKTGVILQNLLDNDANLFGELPARITDFDGREVLFDEPLIFVTPRGAQMSVFSDGRVIYDPRGVPEFVRLRQGESITESFVYSVTNFIFEAEALSTFRVEGGSRWHNSALPYDVLVDGSVNPLDVLVLINFINAYGTRVLDDDVDGSRSDDFLDVDNDGSITPLDVLLVINWLNRRGGNSEGEGESSSGAATDWANAVLESPEWVKKSKGHMGGGTWIGRHD